MAYVPSDDCPPGHCSGPTAAPEHPLLSSSGGSAPELNTAEEQQCYLRIENSFREYRSFATRVIGEKRKHYDTLPPRHKAILPNYEKHFEAMQRCVEANASFLGHLVDYSVHHLFPSYWPRGVIPETVDTLTALDTDKVLSTFRQFVRDWSVEGRPEREACYTPILEALERTFPNPMGRASINVLVPGAGLSRLVYEIFTRGFSSQGSEFSHHMLIAGSFVLNHIEAKNEFTIYPFVHHICNNRTREDMLRPILIPDVAPMQETSSTLRFPLGDFSMCAGEFLEVYNKPTEVGAWQAVATCFFIDTAHNIFEYIETIARLLVVGGIWLNVGPLLWHFADQLQERSVELAWLDVRAAVTAHGFEITEEQEIRCTYTANERGLMQQMYTAIYFSAVKIK
jgi:carnosine N-methyltransferase